jgi:hypothetical protein
MKDESSSKQIKEFIGLRSKMYSVLLDDEKNKITAKGVKRSYAEKNIKHADYKRAIFSNKHEDVQQQATFNLIRSFKHKLHSIQITKTSLCGLDDKRVVLDDNIHTRAIGHYKNLL